MIPCLIVEDDVQAQQRLVSHLKTHFTELQIVGTADTLAQAQTMINRHSPKLLFMDINLPDGTAFDLLRNIAAIDYRVVFITAHSAYALEAIKFSALDFLMKPYTTAELDQACHKAIQKANETNYHLKLEAFFHNYAQQSPQEKKIVLKNAENIHLVKIADIIHAQSDNNYTTFFIKGGQKVMVSRPLKEYDGKLEGMGFIRVHQSYLVNMQHVTTFQKKEDMLSLSENYRVPVAQSKKQRLIDYFNRLS